MCLQAAIWLWEETEELYGGSLAGLPVSLGGTVVTSMPQSQNVRPFGKHPAAPRGCRAEGFAPTQLILSCPYSSPEITAISWQ